MDKEKLPSGSGRTEPEMQFSRVTQSESVDETIRSLEEVGRRLESLLLSGVAEDTKSCYPTRRLKAQRLYNYAAMKIESDRLPVEAANAAVDDRVLQEEGKLIKDFTECKLLSVFPAH